MPWKQLVENNSVSPVAWRWRQVYSWNGQQIKSSWIYHDFEPAWLTGNSFFEAEALYSE